MPARCTEIDCPFMYANGYCMFHECVRRKQYEPGIGMTYYVPEMITEVIVPPACKNCLNHPSNGGSGICNCILGNTW